MALQETYKGIVITYTEDANVWRFELRGRERSAQSLANAKAVIDKPEPKSAKAFTRIKAWRKHYSHGYEAVEVTSIAETPSWASSCRDAWITTPAKERAKESLKCLYPLSPHNDKLVEDIKKVSDQIEALHDQMAKLEHKLKCMTVDPEPEN